MTITKVTPSLARTLKETGVDITPGGPGEAHGETGVELAARDGARSGGAGRGHSRWHRFESGDCDRQTGAGDTMGAVASRSGGSD